MSIGLEKWHDFYITVGGGAAALAGLVFVAMSINLGIIFHDSTHKNRAIGTLTGFTAIFIICALALMGDQAYWLVGTEWLIVSGIATFIYIRGVIRAMKLGGSWVGLGSSRLTGGMACYVAQILGSLLLIAGHISGLYIASVAMVISFVSLISGAWLLIVGVHEGRPKR